MPLLLRTVRQNRWLKGEAAAFLERDDVPADSLGDLVTSQNLLSVWEIAQDHSNLKRVVRAVAVGREKLADMGYVVFNSEALTAAGIPIRDNLGASPDQGANAWHRDLVLSGNKLVALAKAILRDGESGVVLKFDLKQLVRDGIRDGQLPEKLESKL